MTAIGGSWNVAKAVSAGWTAAGLDATFRAEWADPTDTDHLPLNDEEARPATPFPYCVFTVEKPVPLGHTTGLDAATERKRTRVGVLFQVFAKRTDAESAKSIAVRMATLIATAFDPGAGLWPMPDGPDYLQRVQRAAEWTQRHDQNTHEAAIRYELFIDSEVSKRPV